MKKHAAPKSNSASYLIDARIEELGDWRGKMRSRLRSLIKEADPEVVEEWKWHGVPVWSHAGLVLHRRDLPGRRESDLRQKGRR